MENHVKRINFINKANILHNLIYDYSLVHYTNNHSKVKIICSKHGIFEQIPNSHLNGRGCPKCSGNGMTNNLFIEKANLIHGNKYDYSATIYNSSAIKVKLSCSLHGIFEQTPNNHLRGHGCPKCSGLYSPSSNEFINSAKKVHSDKYDYSLVNYLMNKSNVKIICQEHGVFKQSPNSHLRGRGCPSCNESKGEVNISEILNKHNITYIKQYRFNNCRDINPLPFDFYLPELNMCVEYDGEQHFILRPFFGGEIGFINRQKRDKIKTNYCLDNKIKLLRISYKEDITNKLTMNLII